MCWADIWAFPLRLCMQKAAIFVLVHKSLSFVVLPCSKFLGYQLLCSFLTHGERSRDTVKKCWSILKSSRNKITQKSLIVFTQIIGIHYSAGYSHRFEKFLVFINEKKSAPHSECTHFFSYYCWISNTSFYPFSSAWKLTRAILQRNADKCARNNII